MLKVLNRIVAFLMVPCLLADPSFASPLAANFCIARQHLVLSLFENEAIEPALVAQRGEPLVQAAESQAIQRTAGLLEDSGNPLIEHFSVRSSNPTVYREAVLAQELAGAGLITVRGSDHKDIHPTQAMFDKREPIPGSPGAYSVYTLMHGFYEVTFEKLGEKEEISSIRKRGRTELYANGVFNRVATALLPPGITIKEVPLNNRNAVDRVVKGLEELEKESREKADSMLAVNLDEDSAEAHQMLFALQMVYKMGVGLRTEPSSYVALFIAENADEKIVGAHTLSFGHVKDLDVDAVQGMDVVRWSDQGRGIATVMRAQIFQWLKQNKKYRYYAALIDDLNIRSIDVLRRSADLADTPITRSVSLMPDVLKTWYLIDLQGNTVASNLRFGSVPDAAPTGEIAAAAEAGRVRPIPGFDHLTDERTTRDISLASPVSLSAHERLRKLGVTVPGNADYKTMLQIIFQRYSRQLAIFMMKGGQEFGALAVEDQILDGLRERHQVAEGETVVVTEPDMMHRYASALESNLLKGLWSDLPSWQKRGQSLFLAEDPKFSAWLENEAGPAIMNEYRDAAEAFIGASNGGLNGIDQLRSFNYDNFERWERDVFDESLLRGELEGVFKTFEVAHRHMEGYVRLHLVLKYHTGTESKWIVVNVKEGDREAFVQKFAPEGTKVEETDTLNAQQLLKKFFSGDWRNPHLNGWRRFFRDRILNREAPLQSVLDRLQAEGAGLNHVLFTALGIHSPGSDDLEGPMGELASLSEKDSETFVLQILDWFENEELFDRNRIDDRSKSLPLVDNPESGVPIPDKTIVDQVKAFLEVESSRRVVLLGETLRVVGFLGLGAAAIYKIIHLPAASWQNIWLRYFDVRDGVLAFTHSAITFIQEKPGNFIFLLFLVGCVFAIIACLIWAGWDYVRSEDRLKRMLKLDHVPSGFDGLIKKGGRRQLMALVRSVEPSGLEREEFLRTLDRFSRLLQTPDDLHRYGESLLAFAKKGGPIVWAVLPSFSDRIATFDDFNAYGNSLVEISASLPEENRDGTMRALGTLSGRIPSVAEITKITGSLRRLSSRGLRGDTLVKHPILAAAQDLETGLASLADLAETDGGDAWTKLTPPPTSLVKHFGVDAVSSLLKKNGAEITYAYDTLELLAKSNIISTSEDLERAARMTVNFAREGGDAGLLDLKLWAQRKNNPGVMTVNRVLDPVLANIGDLDTLESYYAAILTTARISPSYNRGVSDLLILVEKRIHSPQDYQREAAAALGLIENSAILKPRMSGSNFYRARTEHLSVAASPIERFGFEPFAELEKTYGRSSWVVLQFGIDLSSKSTEKLLDKNGIRDRLTAKRATLRKRHFVEGESDGGGQGSGSLGGWIPEHWEDPDGSIREAIDAVLGSDAPASVSGPSTSGREPHQIQILDAA